MLFVGVVVVVVVAVVVVIVVVIVFFKQIRAFKESCPGMKAMWVVRSTKPLIVSVNATII